MQRHISLLIALLVLVCPVLAEDWLTIYNDDLTLVRSKFDLQLKAGRQAFNFDDITSRISPASVIVTPLQGNLTVAEQNYEYDLAGKGQIINKYIDHPVNITTKSGSRLAGVLKFWDGSAYGIIEDGTGRLLIIADFETEVVQLAEMPSNFYTKPTLHWGLIAATEGNYPVMMTYLTGGLSWDVTYNAVWDTKTLALNSWVTIVNRSGKGFNDVTLKLIAGEVNRVRDEYYDYYKTMDRAMAAGMAMEDAAPSFEEKAFHDFHMYTLDQKVSFANNQTKQIAMYPTQNIKAKAEYEYPTWGSGVKSLIKFKNTEENGIGKPLPKGIIKVYMKDTDGNLEFIGEDRIDHTSRNEEVVINTGKAFDIVATTLEKDRANISRTVTERTIQVTIRNNSKESKTIIVTHPMNGNTKIIKHDVKPDIDSNNLAKFSVTVKPDKQTIFTFRERTEY